MLSHIYSSSLLIFYIQPFLFILFESFSPGEINVEAGLGPKFDSLEKDLKSEGLTTMVEKIELLRKTIGENILSDMLKNR